MDGDEYIKDKTKEELLRSLYTDSQVGSKVYEQQRMALAVRCTEDVSSAINRFTDSNTVLSNRLLWLNIILGMFTIVGTALTIWSLMKVPSFA
ncbi:MAG: hypothetical protein RLO04_08760 [Limnobacter sp.]|uniref:hypothetical protein n=1 Tax=Limnobacter sp. TaxID=2003368 RepID=UPI0032ED0ACE